MKIIRCRDKDTASKKAAATLTKYFESNKDHPVLFLSSGGSSLTILDKIESRSLSKNLTVTVLDTRLRVRPDDENFNLLTHTDFYKCALKNRVSFLNPFEHTDILEYARISEIAGRFDELLKNWIENNPDGKIVFTVGMGPDGHIAGILPMADDNVFNGLFNNEKNFSVAYEAGYNTQFPKRLTVTSPFFLKSDLIIGYICGEEKKEKFSDLISNENFKENQFPAIILRHLKNVTIFTDL